jgi:lysophospholipase L1-like esterase
MSSPLGRWTARILIGAASLFLAVCALEAWLELSAARRLYRQARDRFHPFLQVVPPAGLDGVNPDRFRGDAIAVAKPPHALRIFALGGSTTLGISNRFADTYPRLLQQRLQARHSGIRIEVENAGVDWYTTANSFINYSLRVRRFSPDIVIVMHAINDLCHGFAPPWFASGPFKPDYSHYLGPEAAILGPATGLQADYQRDGWMLWRLLGHALRRDPWPTGGIDSAAQMRTRLRAAPVTTFKSLETFAANYDLLVRAIQSDGHVAIAASEPSLYKDRHSPEEERRLWFAPVLCAEGGIYPDLDSMRKGMAQFNGAAKAVAAQHGAAFVDLDAAVPRDLDHFYDDVHMTRAGNERMAEAVALWISAHLPGALPEAER